MESSLAAKKLSSELASLPILNAKGVKNPLSSLLAVNKTMLVFVRHFN